MIGLLANLLQTVCDLFCLCSFTETLRKYNVMSLQISYSPLPVRQNHNEFNEFF